MPWDASAGGGFSAGKPWHEFAPGRERVNVAAQTGEPGSLLSRYRDLIRLRHGSPALARGALEVLSATGPVLEFSLSKDGERVVVAHNLGDQPQAAALPALPHETLFIDPGVSLTVSPSAVTVALPPHASGVFRLR